MDIFTLIIISISLAMDAFTVSIAKGMCLRTHIKKQAFLMAATFGIFQAVMPLIGWFAGTYFEQFIRNIDHWIAFGLLGIIGLKMIYEAMHEDDDEEEACEILTTKKLMILGVATSIDALAVGISFSLFDVNIWIAITLIGLITFVLSYFGALFAHKVGHKFGKYAELAGGSILVLIGLKILLEHLFF
ncbi:MAG: manganese efflux pump MntP family protein [Erysipelotrichaceae bacterium]